MVDGFTFCMDQIILVDDAACWPAWHGQLVSFFEQHTSRQSLFCQCDIAAIIEKAKAYVDQYRTRDSTSLSLYMTLQPD